MMNRRESEGPLIILDDDIFLKCDLTALVQAEFLNYAIELDKDFELSHVQLIKAAKVIMYQLSLINKRQEYKVHDLDAKIQEIQTTC